MRVLRLSNSGDFSPRLPPESRAGNITKSLLEERLREPVEVETRLLWPNDRFPGLAEGWVREFEPDVVFLRMNAYWITWESAPRLVERRLGFLGKQIAKAGKSSARTPWLAENAVYRTARKVTVRRIGGATPFTVEEALVALDATYRRMVAAREEIAIVVRGPAGPHNSAGDAAGAARGAKRHAQFEAGAKALARKYRADWLAMPGQLVVRGDPALFLGDGIHRTEAGEQDLAIAEAHAIGALWQRLRPLSAQVR